MKDEALTTRLVLSWLLDSLRGVAVVIDLKVDGERSEVTDVIHQLASIPLFLQLRPENGGGSYRNGR